MAMTDSEFHRLADEMFLSIENAIETAIDEQDADVDINASGNVLQLEFENGTQLVINKQEPMHEIWLASRTGGYHFAYKDGRWIDDRHGNVFMPFVVESIEQQGGIKLDLA